MRLPRLSLAERKPSPDVSERGDDGISYSTLRTVERRLRDLDHNAEWRGSNKWRICDRMRKSDPKIAGLRSAQNLPLLRAEVTITESEDEDKIAFVRQALLEDFPWRSFLSDCLLSVDYGFSAFAVNWRHDPDGAYRIDELRYLPCHTITPENIFLKRGRIDHVIQTPTYGGTQQTITSEYLLWFAHQNEGAEYTGRPILRAMHKPWYMKERLEILLPILVEKMGGVPLIREVQVLTDAERSKLDEMAASFGIGERMFMRVPDSVEVSLMESKASVSDVLELIRYFDTQLTNVCQAQYLDLGTNQAGSRAYGSTLADMFADSIQAQASSIEDVLNQRGGLIHQLISYNFPNDNDVPKLRFSSVQHTDIQTLANALQKLQQSGMITPDAELEEFIRDMVNLPAAAVTSVPLPGQPQAKPEAVATPPASDGQTPETQEEPGEAGTRAAECSCGHAHLKLAERREPRGVECYVALDEVSQRFDYAKDAIREATEDTRAKLVAELAGRAIAARNKGTLSKFAAASPPMVDKLAADIRPVLGEFYAAGKQQVADELQRQKDGEPVTEIVAERTPAEGPSMALAEKKPKRQPLSDDDLEDEAAILARKLAGFAQVAAAAQVLGVAVDTLSQSVVEEMLAREVTGEALRMGAKVSDYMQAGRADAAVEQAADIQDAVYSAILDEALCDVCAAMDGEVTTDLDAAANWTPNAGCEGGPDRCRCVAIYEYRQEAR